MENAKKKDVWVVTGEVIPKGDLVNRRVYGGIYKDFESAENGFRGLIRRLSEEEGIIGSFLKGFDSWGYEDDYEYSDELFFQSLAKSLTEKILRGNDVSAEASNYLDLWGTNYMFSYEVSLEEEPVFQIQGDDDGPCNGISPVLYTNSLVMRDPSKHYCFIVEPRFAISNSDEEPSRITVDLLKMEV